eukprot:TRINITY_DN9920_c0_g1_i1.p1 TRINITY_DN9920_c0_g1~~TRINITY_DN9920_c0_g1_i1.p1  ORF type:complete len:223 (-),score=33.53 TRINITY_DN9920_c0_g1_i1:231-899(-)
MKKNGGSQCELSSHVLFGEKKTNTGTQNHSSHVRSLHICTESNTGTQFLFSASNDGTIKQWCIVNAICLFTFNKHKNDVTCLHSSQSFDGTGGQHILSGSKDRSLKLWSVDQHPTTAKKKKSHVFNWINQDTIYCDCIIHDFVVLKKDNTPLLYIGGANGVVECWERNTTTTVDKSRWNKKCQDLIFSDNIVKMKILEWTGNTYVVIAGREDQKFSILHFVK